MTLSNESQVRLERVFESVGEKLNKGDQSMHCNFCTDGGAHCAAVRMNIIVVYSFLR